MNPNTSMDIPISKAMQQVTMKVRLKGVRSFKVRLTVSVWLLRLAALLPGCNVQVEQQTNDQT